MEWGTADTAKMASTDQVAFACKAVSIGVGIAVVGIGHSKGEQLLVVPS